MKIWLVNWRAKLNKYIFIAIFSQFSRSQFLIDQIKKCQVHKIFTLIFLVYKIFTLILQQIIGGKLMDKEVKSIMGPF